MIDLWDEFGPPVYQSVAAYLGMSKPKKKKQGKPTKKGDDPSNLMQQFPGGII